MMTNRYLCSQLINYYIIHNEKTCFVTHRYLCDDGDDFVSEGHLRFNFFSRAGKRGAALYLQP